MGLQFLELMVKLVMDNITEETLQTQQEPIHNELKKAYFSYADFVIRTRSLPDVRDGLKPVQRRILFSMYSNNNRYNDKLKKSAHVVGNVIGELHPHGDSPVYQALARMGQDFNTNMMYIQKQGNFGSIDGDSPAGMRYTEVKMSLYAEEFFKDYDKKTVPMQKNYDGSIDEPCVLPCVVPNLLINGSYGIAVGISTSIPPHNINEVVNALLFYLEKGDSCTIDELLTFIKGPDLPTGGDIFSNTALQDAYTTGEGSFVVRAKYEIENDNVIIIKEIPYQISKSALIKQIGTSMQEKNVEGISVLRDESDRDGIRIFIKIKSGYDIQVVLNQLFKYTNLQTCNRICLFAINEYQQPHIYNLKSYLKSFLEFRNRVIINRNTFELENVQKRLHILLGFIITQENLKGIVDIIRNAENTQQAKKDLQEKIWKNTTLKRYLKRLGLEDTSNQYQLSKEQVDSIMHLQLSSLVKIEKQELYSELESLNTKVTECCNILNSQELRNKIIADEFNDLLKRHNTKRKSQIIEGIHQLSNLDAMTPKDIVIILDDEQYIRRVDLDTYKPQNRGGVGISGSKTNVIEAIITNTHSIIIFFSNKGLAYKLYGYQVPTGANNSKGRALVNLLQLKSEEKISKFVVIDQEKINNPQGYFLCFFWQNGLVRKTKLEEFVRIKVNGKIYQDPENPARIVRVLLINENDSNLFICTKKGKSIVIDHNEFRTVKSRSGMGIRGIKLKSPDGVIDASVLNEYTKLILSVTENGYGKCTSQDEYSVIHRGGSGMINMKCGKKTGDLVASLVLEDRNRDLILFTEQGRTLRMKCEQIPVISRNTIGVKLTNLKQNDKIINCSISSDILDNTIDDTTD